MKKEKSCGAVIVDDGKVLLVYQANGFWSFPKGHVENDETEPETAIREVREETGLNIIIDPKKRFEFSYLINDLNVDKTVVLFPATLAESRPLTLQPSEIREAKWVPFAEVDNFLTFDRWHTIWHKISATLTPNK